MSDRFQPTADTSGGGSGGITQLTQDVLAGPGSGSVAATVVGLRSRAISAVAPTNGQVLAYNTGAAQWTPTTPAAPTVVTSAPVSGDGSVGSPITIADGAIGSAKLAATGVAAATYTNATVTVNAEGQVTSASSGAAPVTSVSGSAPIASSGGATPTISLNNSGVVAATYTNATVAVDAHGLVTSASSGAAPVTSVSGSAPIASTGGTTPTISLNNSGVVAGSYSAANITVDVHGLITSASSGAAAAYLAKFGNVAVVDAVNGNDGTAAINGLPFATPQAAIAAIGTSTGITVWVLPGTYNLTAGITIPANCSMRGLSTQTVTLTMLGVTSATTLVTMGENTRIEDMTLKLTSSASVDLTGIRLPGTTSVTSKVRQCVLTVDNSGVLAAVTTNVYGALSDGTGIADARTFSFNCLKGSTINVFSNGAGVKAGIYQPSGNANQLSTRDLNVYVAQPTDTASTGIYAGVYTNNANSQIQMRATSVSGAPYVDTALSTPVRIMVRTNTTLSGTSTIQGVALVAGDRVLATGQTSSINNGIYVVAAGAWTRALDMAAGSNANNALTPVTEGDFAGQKWLCVSPIPPATAAVVGTNALVFSASTTRMSRKVPVLARYTGGAPTGARAAQGTYTPADGDRLLLDAATNPVDNGIYTYNSGGAWTRTVDMWTGFNSLNSYCIVRSGTDADQAYQCTTTGTVGTTALTFVQRFIGADILQGAPQAGNLTNGIQIGPGTDLVTKSAAAKPFNTYVVPTILEYGLNASVPNTGAGGRYMWAGVQTALDTTEVYTRIQQKVLAQGILATLRTSPGSVPVTVKVLKSFSGLAGSAIDTGLTAVLTDGVPDASNYTLSVDFEQFTFLGLRVISVGGGGSAADLTVQVDLF